MKTPTKVIYHNKEYELRKLCKEKDIAYPTVVTRLRTGRSVEEAIDQPVQVQKRKPRGKNKTVAPARQTKNLLFDTFLKHGEKAFIKAVKKEVRDPEKVLDFFIKYIHPHLPKEPVSDGKASQIATIIKIDVAGGAKVDEKIITVDENG
jgi:hypothetical protein